MPACEVPGAGSIRTGCTMASTWLSAETVVSPEQQGRVIAARSEARPTRMVIGAMGADDAPPACGGRAGGGSGAGEGAGTGAGAGDFRGAGREGLGRELGRGGTVFGLAGRVEPAQPTARRRRRARGILRVFTR